MSFNLNELRAQRDRIREHLAWLDAQIAQAEGAAESKQDATLEPPPDEVSPLITPQADRESTSTPTPETEAVSETDPPPVNIPLDHIPGGFDGASKLCCIFGAIVLVWFCLLLIVCLPFLF